MSTVPFFGDVDLSQVPDGWTWITPHETPHRPNEIEWFVHMGYVARERNRALMAKHRPGVEESQFSKFGHSCHITEDSVSITNVSVLKFTVGGSFESCPGHIGAKLATKPREFEEVGVPVWGY